MTGKPRWIPADFGHEPSPRRRVRRPTAMPSPHVLPGWWPAVRLS